MVSIIGLVEKVGRACGTAGLFVSKKRGCGTTTTSPPELCDFMFVVLYPAFKVLFNVLMLSFFYIRSLFDLMIVLLYTLK